MCIYYNIEALLRPTRCTHTHTHTLARILPFYSSYRLPSHDIQGTNHYKPPFPKKKSLTVFGRFKENGVFHLKPCFLLRFSKRSHTNSNVFMLAHNRECYHMVQNWVAAQNIASAMQEMRILLPCSNVGVAVLYGARGRLNLN